jgi:tetratricopeptide (TPR) repeat protein
MSDQDSQAQGMDQQLNAPDEVQSVRYADFLQQREADIKGFRQLAALDEIEAEFENIRTAWNWAVQHKDYDAIDRALESLDWFCLMRGRHREAESLFQLAREQLAPGPGEKPHPVWARIVARHPDPAEDRQAQIEQSLHMAQKRGDQEETAYCLRALGEVAFNAEDYAKALPLYEESLAHYRTLDDGFNVAATLDKLAQTYRLWGEPEKAIECARQSLDLSCEIGDRFWAASSLVNTGVIAFYTGNYAESEGYLREANTIYREMGHRAGVASSNLAMSKLAHVRGDHDKGKALVEEALEIAMDIGNEHIAQSARRLLGEKVDEGPAEPEPVAVMDIPPTIDRFEVKGLLGASSLSAVYMAHDPDSGRDVVLKVANPEALKRSEWLLKGFRQAAELTKLSQHPAFPKVYDYGETAEHVYMVVEYIEGKDLGAILDEQDGFLPERDVIRWAIQICDALTYMHNLRPAPFIYRDVKPANVMVDHHGRVRLIEFLIAEPYRAGREQTPIGTEGYAAPEQYFLYSDARSDVYALGATLHYLLTRRDPRRHKPFSFHDAPPRSLNPAISEELETVVMKAVEHHPEDRYQSTEEMKAALLACL